MHRFFFYTNRNYSIFFIFKNSDRKIWNLSLHVFKHPFCVIWMFLYVLLTQWKKKERFRIDIDSAYMQKRTFIDNQFNSVYFSWLKWIHKFMDLSTLSFCKLKFLKILASNYQPANYNQDPILLTSLKTNSSCLLNIFLGLNT